MRLFFLTLVVIFSVFHVSAQDAMVVIDSIFIEGNKKTKNRIILRELTFSQGDSLPLSTMAAALEQNKLRLMNTNLFLTAYMIIRFPVFDVHFSG